MANHDKSSLSSFRWQFYIAEGLLSLVSIYSLLEIKKLHEELQKRPALLVVDPAQLAVKNVPLDQPEKLTLQFAALQRTIDNYKAQGYVIVNSTNVLAAPDDIYITQDEVATDLVDSVPDAPQEHPTLLKQ